MNTSGRIQIHGAGVGELSESDLERRAAEIARMDGRSAVNAADRSNAREELLHSGPPPAPEADETVHPVRLWSESMGSIGHQAPRIGPEDEESPVEQLFNEGLEEAERDQRLSASENAEED
jgi:hypothetical protein